MTENRMPGTQAKRIMNTNPGQPVKEAVMADRHAKNLYQKASTART